MTSKIKRTAALILSVLVLASVCSGCNEKTQTKYENSNNSVSSDTTEEKNETAERLNIYSEDFIQTMKDRIADEAKKTDNIVKMTVWCSGDDFNFEKSLVEEFQQLYSDDRYTFKIKIDGSVGEDSAGEKILENTKDGADVFSFADDQTELLAEEKVLAPVDSLFKDDVLYGNTANSVNVCLYQDEMYAFPKTFDIGYILYYDKRILNEEDVKDMDTIIKKSAENNKSVYFRLDNAQYSSGIFMAAGVELKYKDGIQTANFDSEEGLKAAKTMAYLAKSQGNGFIGAGPGEGDSISISSYCSEGMASAMVTGTWIAPLIKDCIGEENMGAAKLPTVLMDGEQVQLHSFGGYKVTGVNAYSQYPVTSQLLAYYLTDSQNQIKRYEERGYIPTNKTVFTEDKIKNIPEISAFQEQRPYEHPQHSSVGKSYWNSGITELGSEIVNSKGDIEDEKLKSRLSEIQKYINDNNGIN